MTLSAAGVLAGPPSAPIWPRGSAATGDWLTGCRQKRPYNLAAGTLLADPADPTAQHHPDRRAAWMLRKCGYLDVAWQLYRDSGDERLLHRTVSDDRIDRIHVSEPLGKAVSDHQRLTEPAGAIPHDGVAADTDAVDRRHRWTYR